MSSQPPMGGHLAFPQMAFYIQMNLMSSHLPQNATFPVSQGWLLIAGSTVLDMSPLRVRWMESDK